MKKIVFITNIPSPYRVDFFSYFQDNYADYETYIVYAKRSVNVRKWNIDNSELKNSFFLDSKEIAVKTKFDSRHIHFSFKIVNLLNKLKPDAVIAWEYSPISLLTLLWCKINKVSYVHLTDGTLFSERNINFFQKLSRKFIINNSNVYIASSTKAKEKLLSYKVDESKINVGLLTVNLNNYRSAQRDIVKGRILYVGSMIERKGLDLLFKALANLNNDFNLHIVGNGTDEEISTLKSVADKLSISDKITFCGFKEGEALKQEYNQAEVFVLPTREDCFGLVLLEALYAGVPVVSSKYADGAYDVLQDDYNGIIADPYNSNEFATAIETALSNSEMQNNALNTDFSKFYFENVATEYLKAIESALN